MAAKKATPISIRPMEHEIVSITIDGTTPLIVHRWSEKARREMLDKQKRKTRSSKTAKEPKIPVNDAIDSAYWLTPKPEHGKDDDEAQENFDAAIGAGAKFGFPVNGIKSSFITGAYRAGLDVKMVELYGAIGLSGIGKLSTFDIAQIDTPEPPSIREDVVIIGGMSRVADLRYRLEFWPWSISLKLDLDVTGKYSMEQVLNCIDRGGRYSGIGEWRPEKKGHNGMYVLRK